MVVNGVAGVLSLLLTFGCAGGVVLLRKVWWLNADGGLPLFLTLGCDTGVVPFWLVFNEADGLISSFRTSSDSPASFL